MAINRTISVRFEVHTEHCWRHKSSGIQCCVKRVVTTTLKGGGDFSLMVMQSKKNSCLTLQKKVLQSFAMTENYSSNDMAGRPGTLASSW